MDDIISGDELFVSYFSSVLFLFYYGHHVGFISDDFFLWSFVVPTAILLRMNLSCFLICLTKCIKIRSTIFMMTESATRKKRNLKIGVKLVCVMGLPWLFGFLSNIPDHVIYVRYISVIITSLQGFFLGFTFILMKQM